MDRGRVALSPPAPYKYLPHQEVSGITKQKKIERRDKKKTQKNKMKKQRGKEGNKVL
jgi:hypothetical protein